MAIIRNDLRAVDLNLLVVFEALDTTRSVTRAAGALGLGQPAVSQALVRLRRLFGDELFVRAPGGMRPTARALELAPAIAETLAGVRRLVSAPPAFDPATARRLFRLGMPDDQELVLVPRLLARLCHVAPGCEVQLRSIDRERGRRLLDDGEVDLAIGAFDTGPSWHRRAVLAQDGYACLYDPARVKAARPIDLATFLAHGHVLVSLREDRVGRLDAVLAERGLDRRLVLTTPRFLALPAILAAAPLIATLPARMAATLASAHDLANDPVPVEMATYEVAMVWHAAADADPALAWLRETVIACWSAAPDARAPA
jgi:DNA-binding transcriptional LysR family regulator